MNLAALAKVVAVQGDKLILPLLEYLGYAKILNFQTIFMLMLIHSLPLICRFPFEMAPNFLKAA